MNSPDQTLQQRTIDKLLLSFNFQISLAGMEFRASKVRNIEREIEVEEVREGGLNGYVHSLVRPASSGKRLVIERGYCDKDNSDKIQGLLGQHQATPMTIAIYNRTHTEILKNYKVEGWTLVKWALSELDAGASGGILMETVEIIYEQLGEETA